jgi:hypothetical protein
MDTHDHDKPAAVFEAEHTPEFAHYSTGRLTPAQAQVVDRWRARLLEDVPLPGQEPVPIVMRLLGMDNRPKASSSDVLAAALRSLLQRNPPTGLDLARYAEAGRQAARHSEPSAPVCQPVSFYLPEDLHAAVTELRARAVREWMAEREELCQEAEREHPGEADQQALWVVLQLRARGLPVSMRQVPRGAIARMAIDHWAKRPVDTVAAEAADYAAEVHGQAHRARKDMRKLRS